MALVVNGQHCPPILRVSKTGNTSFDTFAKQPIFDQTAWSELKLRLFSRTRHCVHHLVLLVATSLSNITRMQMDWRVTVVLDCNLQAASDGISWWPYHERLSSCCSVATMRLLLGQQAAVCHVSRAHCRAWPAQHNTLFESLAKKQSLIVNLTRRPTNIASQIS